MRPSRYNRAWAHWYRRALPTYWLSLFILTHLPKLRIPGEIPQSDKIAHFGAYGLLAFLLWRFVETFGQPLTSKVAPRLLALIAAYGVIDEVLQGLVGRSSDAIDWAADMVGAVGVLAFLEWRRRADASRDMREAGRT
ncbi:MAG: VanZ family protein [Phycisphaerales bacterium]|nr:VanZ family protein [Phycisphaerales bacterium]